MDTDINALFGHIDTNQVKYIQRLSYAVAIISVSAWPETRPDTRTMVEWTQQELEKLGVQTELRELGDQTFPDGTKLPLPPVLLGSLGNDPQKKTLLVYGHLDVQSAKKEDGWDTEPFVLTEVDGKLYGRGSTDDKVGDSFREGMKESGSQGLEHLVVNLKDSFLKDVDFVSISDNYWLGKKKPCVIYGVRGISYFYVKIDGSTKDLDSGENGGTVYEAMTDVVAVLNSLVDVRGRIQIPGIYDTVAEVTEEERDSYGPIDFDLNDYRKDVGVNRLLYDNKTDVLMHRWRYPSLSIHGIEGGVAEAGSDTVIPGRVIGKFSIRLVPDQHPDEVEQRVKEHIANVWKTHRSPNKISVSMGHGGEPWVSDFNDPNFVAGRNAMKTVFGVEPDLTREGGSIPVTVTFQEAAGKNVTLLPIGTSDDGAHSQNEKIDRSNYINGAKVFGAYIKELAKLP